MSFYQGGYGGGGYGGGGYGGGSLGNTYGSNFGGGQYGGQRQHQNYGSGGYGGYGGQYSGGSSNYGETNWCPSGYDGPLYCPSSGYDYNYNHCCSSFLWFGSSCCNFGISIWNIILIVIACILLLGILIYGLCWCMPNSPLNRRARNIRTRQPQQQHPPGTNVITTYEQEPFRHY